MNKVLEYCSSAEFTHERVHEILSLEKSRKGAGNKVVKRVQKHSKNYMKVDVAAISDTIDKDKITTSFKDYPQDLYQNLY